MAFFLRKICNIQRRRLARYGEVHLRYESQGGYGLVHRKDKAHIPNAFSYKLARSLSEN